MRVFIALLAFAAASLAALPAAAEKRVALVIGNDTYAEVPVLLKARNDANAVASSLRASGFEVILLTDATRRETNRAVAQLAATTGPGDVALFFYAGHGVEISGENYLLPVDIPDAKPGMEDFVREEAIGLSDILDRMRSTGARLTIALVDACRDNPFADGTGRSVGNTRGLGRIAAPEGTFVMFSAGAGQTALDRLDDADADPNSVFTRQLLPLLGEPGLGLREMAVTLRTRVNTLAKTVAHRQTPAYYDELLGDFSFLPGEPGADATGNNISGASPEGDEGTPPSTDTIRADYERAREIGTPAAWEAFLASYAEIDAGSLYVALAEEALRVATAPVDDGGTATPPAGGGDTGDTGSAPLQPDDITALTRAARRFLDGEGVPRDATRARALFSRAASAGDAEAMQYMGWIAEKGLTGPKDPAAARDWYKRAAEAGRPLASYLLGRLMAEGEGGTRDLKSAARLYTLAAEGGEAVAMTALGHAYHRGRGVTLDFDRARRWYGKAAAKGDSGAMYNLGEMHDSGEGVTRSGRIAAHWFVQAVGHGNRGALDLMIRNAPRYQPATWREANRLLAEAKRFPGTRTPRGWSRQTEIALRAHLGTTADAPVLWPSAVTTAAVRPAAALAGRWAGLARQTGWGTFRVQLTLTADGKGRSHYPTLGCDGALDFDRTDGAERIFAESITRETRLDCQGGTVHLERKGPALSWRWFDKSGVLRATAMLKRR